MADVTDAQVIANMKGDKKRRQAIDDASAKAAKGDKDAFQYLLGLSNSAATGDAQNYARLAASRIVGQPAVYRDPHNSRTNVGKVIGGLAKAASFIPGVGVIPGAVLGGVGALASGKGLGGALKGAAMGAIPGVARGLAKGLKGASGLKGIISTAASKLGGPGLPGSKGSLIGQLATAVPGVIGAVQGMKARSQANSLLGQQAAEGQSLLEGARPLRTTAQSMILNRLRQPGGFSFASDRLNPFASAYGGGAAPAPAGPAAAAAPAETDEERRKRLLLGAGGGVPPAPNYMAAAGVR